MCSPHFLPDTEHILGVDATIRRTYMAAPEVLLMTVSEPQSTASAFSRQPLLGLPQYWTLPSPLALRNLSS